MSRVRITVLKKEFYPELAQQYLNEGEEAGACPLHAVGDCYIYEGGAEKPDGLCPWAWISLYNAVCTLAAGGDRNTWYRDGGTRIRCCTDVVRPVVFRLEMIHGEE